jgi:hypothetical protein
MAAGKNEHIPLYFSDSGKSPIGPSSDVPRRFTVGAAIAEDYPTGALCQDLGPRPTFVVAIIPFDEIGGGLGQRPVAAKFARAHRSLKRARENPGEGSTGESRLKQTSLFLAALGQGEIR